jgi:hypothetical protein
MVQNNVSRENLDRVSEEDIGCVDENQAVVEWFLGEKIIGK